MTQQKFKQLSMDPQLINNLESQGYKQLFPIQKTVIQNYFQNKENQRLNYFISAPCGSGKTLAALLPIFLETYQNTFSVVIYLAPNLQLCKQVHSVLHNLVQEVPNFILHDIEEVLISQSNFNLLAKEADTFRDLNFLDFTKPRHILQQLLSTNIINHTHIIIATPQLLTLQTSYLQIQGSLNYSIQVIIDEADYQIKNYNTDIQLLIKKLQENVDKVSLNNSFFSYQYSRYNLRFMLVSATLRYQESLINNINFSAGVLCENNYQLGATKTVIFQFDKPRQVYLDLLLALHYHLLPYQCGLFFNLVSSMQQFANFIDSDAQTILKELVQKKSKIMQSSSVMIQENEEDISAAEDIVVGEQKSSLNFVISTHYKIASESIISNSSKGDIQLLSSKEGRGIDFSLNGLAVLDYDHDNSAELIHILGRCGRGGKSGVRFLFVPKDQVSVVHKLLTKCNIDHQLVTSFINFLSSEIEVEVNEQAYIALLEDK